MFFIAYFVIFISRASFSIHVFTWKIMFVVSYVPVDRGDDDRTYSDVRIEQLSLLYSFYQGN